MTHQGRGLALAGLALCGALPCGLAQAFQVRSEDWTTSLDTTLSYGVSYRMEAPDNKLIARANGGRGGNSALINSDDGDLNFAKHDLFSEVVKVLSELDLRYQESYGLFVRGKAFYDFALEDERLPHRPISHDGPDEAGSSVDLLDAFLYGSWQFDERSLNARLGRQVINWGEGLFYQNGIGATNPVDINALRAPGAEVKEAYMPTFMVYGSYELRDNLTLEGYWQPGWAWEASKIDPCGTYYSTLDVIGEGCNYLSVSPLQEAVTAGRAFDSPAQAQAYADALPPGFLNNLLKAYLPTTFIPRAADQDADKASQYGAAVRWFVPELNDTELGFYYLRYSMQVPMLGLSVGETMTLPVVGALPKASTARYYAEYLERRDLFGASFNTSLGGESLFSGLSLAGELSYRPDTPIALGLGEYLPSALFGATQGLAVGSELDGYHEKDMYQASLAAIYNFTNLLGTNSAALTAEMVGSRVQGLRSAIDYYSATSSAYGAQANLQLTYNNVFNLFNLVPNLGYQYGINGVAPQLTNGLVEDAKSYTLGVDAVYQESFTVGAKYVGYSGGQLLNKRSDRDFLSFNVKYSF